MIDSVDEKRRRLKLTRGSTWNVAETAAIHLDLALGCLQVADDDALTHHVGRAVNALHAVAKLTNEISSIRNGSAAASLDEGGTLLEPCGPARKGPG